MQNKIVKKATALVALILLFTSLTAIFSSCGNSNTAISCEGTELEESIYSYWYAKIKQDYIDSYSDIVDTDEFWLSEFEEQNRTYGEYIDEKIRERISYYLVGNLLFKKYSLKLDSKTIASIDEEINDAINAFGSRSEYDSYLKKKYGIDSENLRKAKLMEQKFYFLYDYLYNSETGVELASASEIDEFYNTSYARIKYYMVRKNYDYQYDKDGNRVTDSTGNYVLVELSEEEQAKNKDKANEYYENVKNGSVNIDTYIKADYSDLYKSYPNGYYVLKTEYYGYLFTATIINAAFELEVGETVLVENEDAFFIVSRYDLPDKAYEGTESGQFTLLASYASGEKFEAKFGEYIKLIEENTEITSKYSVLTVD